MDFEKACAFARQWRARVDRQNRAEREHRARPNADDDLPSARLPCIDASRLEQDAARPDQLMSQAAKSERIGSERDETHWWIAYAKHSAVDGTDGCDKSSHSGERVEADATQLRIAPAQATDR